MRGIVARECPMIDFEQILVPVDGSECAHRAAVFGGRLGAALGMPLKLVYVVPLTTEAVIALAQMTPEQIKAAHEEHARGIFAQAQSVLAASGARPADATVVLVGDAAQEILGHIEVNPRTLVVMGRRGLSTIRGLMLGSVSEKVARHAQCPVTLVH